MPLFASLRAALQPRRPADAAPPSAAALDRPRLAETAIDALPWPALVVGLEADEEPGRLRVLLANAAARGLLRTDAGALLAAAIRDPAVLAATEAALADGRSGETLFEPASVQARVWRARATPLPAEAEQAPRVLLTLLDETEQRRAESLRSDFLANASHELRTPLAALSGFIETLRGHARDDAAARDRFLTVMATQADRMKRLLDDLLSLSRIELDEHRAPTGEADLAQVAREVVELLGPLARERQVRFTVAGPPQALVAGDRDQLVQVVQNLGANALKYSPAGGVVALELTVSGAEAATAQRDPQANRLSLLTPDRGAADRYAVLRVSDTGPGVAREHLPRLSERFYRVEGQKSGAREGTGLGLAIVKHVVNRHRGGVSVESRLGVGSSFVVYLPLARVQPAVARAA